MVRDQGRGERKVKSSHKDKTLVSSFQLISLSFLFPMAAMSRWHDFEVPAKLANLALPSAPPTLISDLGSPLLKPPLVPPS